MSKGFNISDHPTASLLGIIGAIYALKLIGKPQLKYFSYAEFGAWYPLVSNTLLIKLDSLREKAGQQIPTLKIMISPALGAIGRLSIDSAESQHNIQLPELEIRAVDVMPFVENALHLGEFNKYRSLNSAELKKFYAIAQSVGFTGIGVYPQWKPYAGFHLDVRKNPKYPPNDNWSAKYVTVAGKTSQVYGGLQEAFA